MENSLGSAAIHHLCCLALTGCISQVASTEYVKRNLVIEHGRSVVFITGISEKWKN